MIHYDMSIAYQLSIAKINHNSGSVNNMNVDFFCATITGAKLKWERNSNAHIY